MTDNKNLIIVTYPDTSTVTLDANKGEWTDYTYDGAAFVVQAGKTLVGLYNFAHVRSIEVKASAKEDTPNA